MSRPSEDVLRVIWRNAKQRTGERPRFPWRAVGIVGRPMAVFPFTDAARGARILQGRCRGLGPISTDLGECEEPVGLWDEAGRYYVVHIDVSREADDATVIIDDIAFSFPITKCITTRTHVDPQTARLVGPIVQHYPGTGDLERIDPEGDFGPGNVTWIQRAEVDAVRASAPRPSLRTGRRRSSRRRRRA